MKKTRFFGGKIYRTGEIKATAKLNHIPGDGRIGKDKP
jgi:hypothetical protein